MKNSNARESRIKEHVQLCCSFACICKHFPSLCFILNIERIPDRVLKQTLLVVAFFFLFVVGLFSEAGAEAGA